MHHRLLVVAAVLGGLGLAACGSEPPPEPPPPAPVQQVNQDSIDSIADSIAAARAEEARLAAQAEAERQRLRAVLEQTVHFDYDQSTITPESQALLNQKAAILRASPAVQLRLEGHADERGSVEYNQALGNRRAQSVLDFFSSGGVNVGSYQTTSFGEERPVAMASNEAAWAQNRRVEFVIFSGGDQINPGM